MRRKMSQLRDDQAIKLARCNVHVQQISAIKLCTVAQAFSLFLRERFQEFAVIARPAHTLDDG